MTMTEYYELCDYWADRPPEHESLAMLLEAQTSWEPNSRRAMSEEQAAAEHRRSLEQRWRAGAMNIQQMWQATGGVLTVGGVQVKDGKPPPMGGIGPFPGAS